MFASTANVPVQPVEGLPRCQCDECAQKSVLIDSSDMFAVVQKCTPGPSPMDDLREELASHARKAAQAPQDNKAMGDCFAIRKPNSKRPWLSYDADALMPKAFDCFLLGGGCRRVPWMKKESLEERSKVTLEVSLCYIVGCGRSGTTILAELMSRYAGVVFLNEPRQLWIPLLPAMDIWSVAAPDRQGRLIFTPEDGQKPCKGSEEMVTTLVMDAYHNVAELAASPPLEAGQARPVLVVEKFPEHAFRIPFLTSMCQKHLGPGRCTIMHIVRDGVDTARSIASYDNPAAWYGVKDEWKWKSLMKVAVPSKDEEPAVSLDLSSEFIAFLDLSRTDKRCRFARGLVEWSASVLTAREGAKEAQDARYLEIHYQDLVIGGALTLSDLTSHLDLEPSASARQCAKETLASKPSKPLTDFEKEVLVTLRGSQVEKLLREFGRELPH